MKRLSIEPIFDVEFVNKIEAFCTDAVLNWLIVIVFATELIDTTCVPLGIPIGAFITAPTDIPSKDDKNEITFESFDIVPITDTMVVSAGIMSPWAYIFFPTVKF